MGPRTDSGQSTSLGGEMRNGSGARDRRPGFQGVVVVFAKQTKHAQPTRPVQKCIGPVAYYRDWYLYKKDLMIFNSNKAQEDWSLPQKGSMIFTCTCKHFGDGRLRALSLGTTSEPQKAPIITIRPSHSKQCGHYYRRRQSLRVNTGVQYARFEEVNASGSARARARSPRSSRRPPQDPLLVLAKESIESARALAQ